ncbi:hypothetical protein COCOBI_09-5970 [Coccomyxa sp. Obi]|nr:hypothetical protein COCOBI_09-5970 [Coccomyxa sp. Obi]
MYSQNIVEDEDVLYTFDEWNFTRRSKVGGHAALMQRRACSARCYQCCFCRMPVLALTHSAASGNSAMQIGKSAMDRLESGSARGLLGNTSADHSHDRIGQLISAEDAHRHSFTHSPIKGDCAVSRMPCAEGGYPGQL